MSYHDQIINKSESNTVTSPQESQTTPTGACWSDDDATRRQNTSEDATCSEMYALSRRGLWGLLSFLLISIAAFLVQDFNLYQTLPEPVLQILGCPPPAFLIHLALTTYSFAVVVPVLIRMATGENPAAGWYALSCRSIFYLFYLTSGALPENFIAVISIGIILYAIEQIGIWSYMYKHLREAEA